MPHRSRLISVLIDCDRRTMDEAVRFWSAALGRARKADDDPAARYAHLETPADSTVDVLLQATTAEHLGMHLDIETDDVDAEVRRLEELGAVRKRQVQDWWVMSAPSGHAFCVIPVQSDQWPAGAIEWPDPD